MEDSEDKKSSSGDDASLNSGEINELAVTLYEAGFFPPYHTAEAARGSEETCSPGLLPGADEPQEAARGSEETCSPGLLPGADEPQREPELPQSIIWNFPRSLDPESTESKDALSINLSGAASTNLSTKDQGVQTQITGLDTRYGAGWAHVEDDRSN